MNSRNLWLLLSLLCSISGLAQKELDSIITVSTPLIFEQPEQAIEIAEDVLKKSTQTETKIKAHILMSSAYLSKRNNRKSLSATLQALDLARGIENIQTKIEVLNTAGMQHQQLRMYDKAKDYLEEALVLTNSLKPSDRKSYLLAYNYTIRGFIYREQMNCKIAPTYFDRAIINFESSGKSMGHTANISTLYYNKGNCFLQTSQVDSAKVSFKKSIDFADKAEASSLLSFAKKGLSEVYTAKGKYDIAILHLLEANSIASNVGDMVLNRGIYQNLANNFLAVGDKNQYEFYEDLYQKSNQDLLRQENLLINESLKNSIRTIQKKSEHKLKRLKIFTLIVFISASIVLIFLIWTTLKSRKLFLTAKNHINTRP